MQFRIKVNFTVGIFIFFCLLIIVFRVEFYPFSNYQMYAENFLPNPTYSYLEIMEVDTRGTERPFINKNYGIFFSKRPLIEALSRHRRLNGTDYKDIARALLVRANSQNSAVVALKIYEIIYDWEPYKESFLRKDGSSHQFVERNLIELVTL